MLTRYPKVPTLNGKLEKGQPTRAWLFRLSCCKARGFGTWCVPLSTASSASHGEEHFGNKFLISWRVYERISWLFSSLGAPGQEAARAAAPLLQ